MDVQTTAARSGRAAYDAVKRSLFADLRGTVLEIGAGKGANFGLLPDRVRWVGLEPARRRRRRLARGRAGLVLAGVGEQIPLRDHSVDAVISTIVLCSVRGTRARRWQHALAPWCRRFDAGCDPSRETWLAIERAGFTHVELEWFTLPPSWSIYNPCIAGRAVALWQGTGH